MIIITIILSLGNNNKYLRDHRYLDWYTVESLKSITIIHYTILHTL